MGFFEKKNPNPCILTWKKIKIDFSVSSFHLVLPAHTGKGMLLFLSPARRDVR